MAIQAAKVIVVLTLLVNMSGAFAAGEDAKCSKLVHVPCGERAGFSVAFDSSQKLADVSLAPGSLRHPGDLKAAACYSAHSNQIPMLRKMLEYEREGKSIVPASFSFEIVTHCEGPDFIQPAQEP